MTTESRDTLTKAEAGVEENTDIIDDMRHRSRFPEINDRKILICEDPTKNKLNIDDLMKVMKHPKMEKLFLLDRAWYPLITEDMITIIQNQFDKCYESDKQAILNGKMKGGNVLSRTEEILNRIYERAFVVITEMSDTYARCAIIINTDMNLEYNDGLIGMRIFLVHRYQKEDYIVVSDFRAHNRHCFRDSTPV